MKIGFDISDLATGRADGTTRYTYELARRLPGLTNSHSWDYFTPGKPTTAFGALPANANIRVSPWPKYWTQFRLPGALYQHRPDVIFMPIQQLPYIRPKQTKTVAVIHDLAIHYYPEQFTYKDWLLLHVFSAQVARDANHIIAVSESTAADIKKFYGRSSNVYVVHHGVDHEQFYFPNDEQRDTSRQELLHQYPKLATPYVLYVGQIQPRKNIVRLVEAFTEVAKTDHEVALVIAGGHGWLQQPIMAAIAKPPVRDRIHVLGAVPQSLLPALYWHADVFVLPSLYEGFGLPIVEAMACGTPVVTSDISALPEVAGNAAVIVNPHDTAALTAGIRTARDNHEVYRERGLVRAQQFSWDKTAQQTLAVLTAEI